MSQPVPSPTASRLARPGWLDLRLVAGVLLVLVSVVVGARVLASADRTSPVWVLARDMAIGSTLSADDLTRQAVRLEDTDQRYVTAPTDAKPPVGYVLLRGLGAGELLPRAALRLPETGEGLRDVTVPVEAGHLPPDLRSGQLVDVYLTIGKDTDAQARATSLLLRSIAVRDRSSSASRTQGGDAVVLSVGPADAATLVTALRAGTLDLVRVPEDAELAPLTPVTVTDAGSGTASPAPSASPPEATAEAEGATVDPQVPDPSPVVPSAPSVTPPVPPVLPVLPVPPAPPVTSPAPPVPPATSTATPSASPR